MFLVKFLLKHKVLIFFLVILSLLAAFMEGVIVALLYPIFQGFSGASVSAGPVFLNNISHMFGNYSMTVKLQIVAIFIFIATVLKSILIQQSIYLSARLKMKSVEYIRMECVKQLMRLGMSFFNKQHSSNIQVIVEGYPDSTAGAIVNLIGISFPLLFTTIFLFGFLVIFSWKLTVVALFLMAFATLLLGGISKAVMDAGKRVITARYGFNRILFDIIYGLKTLRLFNREEQMTELFHKKVIDYNKADYQATVLSGMVSPLFEVIGIGVLSIVLFAGALLISNEYDTWLGVLLTFVITLTKIIAPVRTLNQNRAMIMVKLPALYELGKFLDTKDKAYLSNGSIEFKGLKNAIEFRSVDFKYNPQESIVLRDVSFVLEKGNKIGIVGPSGAGKSTIAELLLRFYDPQKGGVFVDGIDLRKYNIFSWRRRIGVVSQDTFLFHDTIRANILFAKPDAADTEIELAAARAHAHDFISELPLGYDTIVGERGVLLSGGQRQRIAIARAILAEPEILVFDEATSALDTESEKIVQSALSEVAAGRTVIAIAHRLSTIIDSDKIIVIDEGHIVEQGIHNQLLEKGGLYNKLAHMQFMGSRKQ